MRVDVGDVEALKCVLNWAIFCPLTLRLVLLIVRTLYNLSRFAPAPLQLREKDCWQNSEISSESENRPSNMHPFIWRLVFQLGFLSKPIYYCHHHHYYSPLIISWNEMIKEVCFYLTEDSSVFKRRMIATHQQASFHFNVLCPLGGAKWWTTEPAFSNRISVLTHKQAWNWR